MTTQSDRNSLRKLVRQKRQSLTEAEQFAASSQICEHLVSHPKIANASSIAIYLANDGELNTTPFIQWCWQNNKQVYLPVLHPFSKGHLLFLRYSIDTKMAVNKYGISEPFLDVTNVLPTHKLDVIFTPLVAFDGHGNRLGMGGGFYDRTLANWQTDEGHEVLKPYPIGLAHDCQLVEQIPTEHWDVPIPEIVTPSAIHTWQ